MGTIQNLDRFVDVKVKGDQLSSDEIGEITDVIKMLKNASNATHELNLHNEIQYKFVLNNLIRTGMTNSNAPKTFKELKAAHESGGNKTDIPKIEQQYISGQVMDKLIPLNKITYIKSQWGQIKVGAVSSYPGGTYKTTIVQNLIAFNGNTISEINSRNSTQYLMGKNFNNSFGSEFSVGEEIVVLTMFILFPKDNVPRAFVSYINGGKNEGYVGYEIGDPFDKVISVLEKPCHEHTPVGGPIVIALGRETRADMIDYGSITWENNQYFVFPIKGRMKFNNNIDTSSGGVQGGFQIYLQNEDKGGAYFLHSTSPIEQDPAQTLVGFQVSDEDPSTVTWDFTNAQFKIASNQLVDQNPQDLFGKSYLTLELQILTVSGWASGNFTSDPSKYGSSEESVSVFYKEIPKLKILWGCLIAGTKISLADGTLKAVEDFTGCGIEIVKTDNNGGKRPVTGTTTGLEEKLCVTFKDKNGKSLMLTEDHPIVTRNRGVVLAKYLEKGDILITEEGTSEIAETGREKYDGRIWNLELGTVDEAARDETTMYADGFLVGDFSMQQYYCQKDQEIRMKDQSLDLPDEWYEEYKIFASVK